MSDGLSVRGNHAYVVGGDHLSVIDISDPQAPVMESYLTDVFGRLSGAFGIFIRGDYAYVSTGYQAGSDRLTVIDISDPSAPRIISSVQDHTNLDGALHVYVSGNYAFVTAPHKNRMSVVDVADPQNPKVVGSVKDDSKLFAADGIWIAGNIAYVVSHHMQGPGIDYLNAIDVSDPRNPRIVGSLSSPYFRGGDQMAVQDNYAYVPGNANNEPTSGHSISVVDVSNKSSMKIVGHISDPEIIGSSCYTVVRGKYLYLTSSDRHRLTIVDVSNPVSPKVAVSIKDEAGLPHPLYVQLAGNYAYVTNDSVFSVIDVRSALKK
ncbi:MAG: hypothetical protein M1309_03780 [Actinobacteria bacterium]|nr:hypothetical protein [Actinomycetota bacterium]